jgi:hypothetical protein
VTKNAIDFLRLLTRIARYCKALTLEAPHRPCGGSVLICRGVPPWVPHIPMFADRLGGRPYKLGHNMRPNGQRGQSCAAGLHVNVWARRLS